MVSAHDINCTVRIVQYTHSVLYMHRVQYCTVRTVRTVRTARLVHATGTVRTERANYAIPSPQEVLYLLEPTC